MAADLDSLPKKNRHGGRRSGAGRPPGKRDTLPRGAVAAIKGLKHRVPADVAPALAELADDALVAVVDVMKGHIRKGARDRLAAAAMVREEICGSIAKKAEVKVEGFASLVQKSFEEDGSTNPQAGPSSPEAGK